MSKDFSTFADGEDCRECRALEKENSALKEYKFAVMDSRERDEQEIESLKAELKEWKRKYKELDSGIRCEWMDPNGTIWDACDKVHKENARLKSLMERVRNPLEKAKNGYYSQQHLMNKIDEALYVIAEEGK